MLNPNYFFLFTVATKAKQTIQKKKNLKPSTQNLKVLMDCD